MKRVFYIPFLAIVLGLFTQCSNVKQVGVDPLIATAVMEVISQKSFTIEITRAVATGGSVVNATGARMVVVNSVVSARLPYYGSGSSASAYGTEGDSGIVFDKVPVEIETDKSRVAGEGLYVMKFTAKSGNSPCEVILSVWTDRTATLICSPLNRSQMTYYGYITSDTTESPN